MQENLIKAENGLKYNRELGIYEENELKTLVDKIAMFKSEIEKHLVSKKKY